MADEIIRLRRGLAQIEKGRGVDEGGRSVHRDRTGATWEGGGCE
jgi:hypothetical protein